MDRIPSIVKYTIEGGDPDYRPKERRIIFNEPHMVTGLADYLGLNVSKLKPGLYGEGSDVVIEIEEVAWHGTNNA